MSRKPFYSPALGPKAPRTPTHGFKLWEIRQGTRALRCELRDDERIAAGVDVQLLVNGELLLSRLCLTPDYALYVAAGFRDDYLRKGWTE